MKLQISMARVVEVVKHSHQHNSSRMTVGVAHAHHHSRTHMITERYTLVGAFVHAYLTKNDYVCN